MSAARKALALALLVVVVGACSDDAPIASSPSSGDASSGEPDAQPPSVESFALKVDPPQILIQPGEEQKITVTLTKLQESFFGRANLVLSNLPPGVSAPAATVDANAPVIVIKITAALNAARGETTEAVIEGTGIDNIGARGRTSFDVTTTAPVPSLDPTFGNGGKTKIGAGVARDDVTCVALQTDGKIVVAGAYRTGYTTVPAIARYLATGALDASFGQGGSGIVLLDTHDSSSATGVALQADGKIIVLEPADFRLTRLLATTGAIDTTFGSAGSGSASASFPTDASGTALVIQPNGSIVVAGGVMEDAAAMTHDFALARFGADGLLDATFGSSGRVITTTAVSANAEDMATSIALQTSGMTTVSIVAAGNVVASSGSRNAVVARYLGTTGALDTTFNTTGIVIASTAAATDDVVSSVAVTSGGKVVAAGHRHDATSDDTMQILRFTTAGVLDASFDGDGIAIVPFSAGQKGYANTLVVDGASGKIVVAGDVTTGPGTPSVFHVALARLDDTGALDGTFGTAGKITSAVNNGSIARAIAMQTDGSLVIAGATISGANPDALVARYVGTTGALDTTFDVDGKVTTSFGPGDEELRAVAVQADGKIVAVGSAFNGSDFDILATRVMPNGAIDTTFAGGRGYLLYDHGAGTSEFAYDLRIQPDGKIVVGGQGGPGTIVLRLTTAGVLDPSFGSGGGIAAIAGGEGFGLALQGSEPKIVVGGPGSATDFFVARLTQAGIVDTGFGTAGTVTTDFGFGDRAITLAVDSKGRIVLAGHIDRGAPPNFFDVAIARYEPNGVLDKTFDTDGKMTFDTTSVELVYAVAVQSTDDKVLVGGRMQRPGQATSLGVFRITSNGAVDAATFGENGRAITDLGDGSQASAIVVEPSRSILVAGRSANDRAALVRLSPSGRMMWREGSDNANGFLTTAFGTRSEAYAMARQNNGAFVIAGFGHDRLDDQAILARYVP